MRFLGVDSLDNILDLFGVFDDLSVSSDGLNVTEVVSLGDSLGKRFRRSRHAASWSNIVDNDLSGLFVLGDFDSANGVFLGFDLKSVNLSLSGFLDSS